MAKEVIVDINAQMSRYERSMGSAIKTASRFDRQMLQLQQTSRAVDKALNKIDGDIKVNVQADTSQLAQAEGDVRALDSIDPTVTVSVDKTAITQVEGALRALDSIDPTISPSADTTAIGQIEGDIRGLDSIDPTVTPEKGSTSAISDIEGQLKNLQTLGVINLTLNAAGMARNAFESTPILSNIQDQEQAIRVLESAQYDVAAGAEAVSAVWTNNWGQSKTEIAGIVTQLQALNVPSDQLADAALSVYELTANGRDLNEVLRAQNVLVTSGAVDTYREAANLLATGFNGPAGTQDDFLDTISEYAPQLRELRVSAEGFLSYLNNGVIDGAWNTDKLADSLKEANVRIQEAVTDPATPYAQALERVGQMDEAQAFVNGEITGEQFFSGLIAAVEERGNDFDLAEILGSGSEDLGSQTLANIDFSGWTVSEDAAATFSTTLTDTTSAAFSTLQRTLSDGFLGTLDTWTGGLDTWIEGAKTKMSTLASELRSGTALPEALEIALEAPGLAERIRAFEAAIGDFVIEMQLVVAGVVEAFGNTDEGTRIRTAVADQAAGQLEYKLQFLDVEDAQANIQQAIDRGVDASKISTIITEVGAALTAEGNFAKVEELVAELTALQNPDTVQVALEYTGPTTLMNAFDPAYRAVITVEIPPGTEDIINYAMSQASQDPAYLPAIEGADGFIQESILGGDALVNSFNRIDLSGLTTMVTDAVSEARRAAAEAFDSNDFTTGFNIVEEFFPEDTGAYAEIARRKVGEFMTTVGETLGDLVVTSDLDGTQALGFENFIDFTEADGRIIRFKDATLLNLGDAEESFRTLGVVADASAMQIKLASDGLLLDLQENTPGMVEELTELETRWRAVAQAAFDAYMAAGGYDGMGGFSPTMPPSTPPGRAIGGEVLAGNTYTVGERGRELFVAGADGLIIPNGLTEALLSMPSASGGGSVTNNYNTVNANISINSQGSAQLMGAGTRMARAIRGF